MSWCLIKFALHELKFVDMKLHKDKDEEYELNDFDVNGHGITHEGQ